VSNLPFKNFVIPIHREGWYFALAAAAITFILTLIHPNLGWVGAVITAWVVYFFRDPERVTPVREGLVISPADGMILSIGQVDPPKELALGEGPWTKISIFLNIFDVHINRIPIDGEIITSHYRPGLFLNASLDKASEDNERQSLSIQTKGGVLIGFVQIAGLIARRIRCDVKEGDKVKAGARFGLIRFGSRADIYLPHGVAPLVIEGQRMIAGETVLADLKSKETARVGEMR
jgi:phosphatidylserine decarboxylase